MKYIIPVRTEFVGPGGCLEACPRVHWDAVIGKYPSCQVAYHTMCFTDPYLSPGEEAFRFRPIHPRGWKEFKNEYPLTPTTPAFRRAGGHARRG